MKIVILADNPLASTATAYSLLKLVDGIDPLALVTAAVPLSANHDGAFAIPRDITIASIPVTAETAFKPFAEDGKGRRGHSLNPCRGLRSISKEQNETTYHTDWVSAIGMDELAECLRSYDRVYVASSSSPYGQHHARRIENWAKAANPDVEFIRLAYGDLASPESFDAAVLGSGADMDDSTREALISSWEIRRYFDYNYLLNSLPVMGLTSTRSLGRDVGSGLYSDSLQALYLARDRSDLSEAEFERELGHWSGTGRHAETRLSGWALGALKYGSLVALDGDNKVKITDDGIRLLEAIHPDCRDPDQKARIEEWQRMTPETAKPKIDQYIRTFFGKQKRFMRKHDSVVTFAGEKDFRA